MSASTAVSIALGLATTAVVLAFVLSTEIHGLRRRFREARTLRYQAGDILVVRLTVPVSARALQQQRRQFERWGEALGARVIVLPVEYDLSVLQRMPALDERPAPAYNHTRGDSALAPCPECRRPERHLTDLANGGEICACTFADHQRGAHARAVPAPAPDPGLVAPDLASHDGSRS